MSTSTLYPIISPSLNLDFTNSKVLDPRVTFARASGATYYDGVTTAKAEENLLLQSQEFDSAAWTDVNIVLTANATTAPDGTSTADSIIDTSSNARHEIYNASGTATTSGATYIVSMFAKENTAAEFKLTFNTAGVRDGVFFNVNSGTVVSSDAGYSGAITSVGNGWYRCTVTMTAGTTATRFFALFLSNGSQNITYIGTGTGIYIWGAQLEQRSSISSYTPTTTQPITNYVPVLQTAANNVPRFDHNPATNESLGLLIEESRTNLITYSADFADAAWTKTDTTITSNTVVAPDGTLTADLAIPNTSSTSHIIQYPNVTTSTTTTSTVSFFVKQAGYTTIHVRYGVQSTTNRGQADINLVTGAVTNLQNVGTATGSSCSVTNIGNDWWRVALSVNPNDAAATQTRLLIYPNVNTAYAGDGYSGVYIWGAQLEAAAFSTSYIATGAATATRSADSASMTGTNFSSWYRADEGSAYTEYAVNATAYNAGVIAFSDGTMSNRMIIRGMTTTNASVTIGVSGGVAQWNNGFTSQTTAVTKWVFGARTDDIAFVRNGGAVLTDTSAVIPVVNQLRLGSDGDGSLILNGYLRRIAYYPLRLTNAQLQALTI